MDIVTVQNVVGFGIVFVIAYPIVYGLGYAFSRGYHKGKREFIARMMRDSCGEGANNGQK